MKAYIVSSTKHNDVFIKAYNKKDVIEKFMNIPGNEVCRMSDVDVCLIYEEDNVMDNTIADGEHYGQYSRQRANCIS